MAAGRALCPCRRATVSNDRFTYADPQKQDRQGATTVEQRSRAIGRLAPIPAIR
jgi:hypothetical protein